MSSNSSMPNKALSDNGLQMSNILIESSSGDTNNLELGCLKLVSGREPINLELTKITQTSWKIKDNIDMPIAEHIFTLVVSSNNLEDVGRLTMDESDLTVRVQDQNGTNNVKQIFEPLNDSPQLCLSFEIHERSPQNPVNEHSEIRVEEVDPDMLYDRIQQVPDEHPMKPDGLYATAELFRRRYTVTKTESDIKTSIKLSKEAIGLLATNDSKRGSFISLLARAHYECYEILGRKSDLDEATSIWRTAVAQAKDDDEDLLWWLDTLAGALLYNFERTGEISNISESIRLRQRAVQLASEDPALLNNLGISLLYRFEQFREMPDISEAIRVQRRAVGLIPDGDSILPASLNSLGNSLLSRYRLARDISDITEAIQLQQRAIQLTSESDTFYPGFLNNLGNSLRERFKQVRDISDLSEAIRLHQHAVDLTPEGHLDLPTRLSNFGTSLLLYSKQTGDDTSLLKSIRIQHRALHVAPEGHVRLQAWLNNLETTLLYRFDKAGELDEISEAIRIRQRIIGLDSSGDSRSPAKYHRLGILLLRRFEKSGEIGDISQSIEFLRRAADSLPDGHTDLLDWLGDLGNGYFLRFQHNTKLADISEAVRLRTRVVQLTGEQDPALPDRLDPLWVSLLRRFQHSGNFSDLSEAIQVQRKAVNLTQEGDSSLPVRLANLGMLIHHRFEYMGELADLSEAIELQERALRITPERRTHLAETMFNLGISYCQRFGVVQDAGDISEAIRIQHQALQLMPEDHRYFPALLDSLGDSLVYCFLQTGEVNVIFKSIQFRRRAVQLTPQGHADLWQYLSGLAKSLYMCFEKLRNLSDISEAIQLQQRAIDLLPDDHPALPAMLTNLGISYRLRFEHTKDLADISESIQVRQRAVELAPEEDANLLNNLGNSYLRLFEHTLETDSEPFKLALKTFRLAAMSSTGPPSTCLDAAKKWAVLSKAYFFAGSEKLFDAHERITYLIPLVAGLDHPLKRRYNLLKECSELSTSAAAAASSLNRPGKALEWLEQGRCIVWSHINQLRMPMDELRASNPALADQLEFLSRQLEDAASLTDPRLPGVMLSTDAKISFESATRRHIKLAKEREELITTIRDTPDFGDFLRPRNYADLMRDLPEHGTVVIINADQERCDALVLRAGQDEPFHIPLERLSYQQAVTLSTDLHDYLSSRRMRSRYTEDADFVPRAVGPLRHPGSRDKLYKVLHILWTDLAEPVLQSIQNEEGENTVLPRIWWCPTGPFAFLPIHAAGIYDHANMHAHCLANSAVSSYIPTLSILNRLKSRPHHPFPTKNNVLLVSQPDTPGLPKIPCTSEEIQKTQAALTQQGIQTLIYESNNATIAAVSESLKSFSSVHLACHASQDITNPLESAIHLYDGPLKLSEIIKKDLPQADFAFLSACQTSAGDETLPEEAVHLAAGMLAAGYKSVVATMWSISDRHAPDIAASFYQDLLCNRPTEDSRTLGDGAARALHSATRSLRETLGNSPDALLAWIPYIHVGI